MRRTDTAELLLVDVGNTAIKLALANKEKLLARFSLPTGRPETEDSLGLELLALVARAGAEEGSLKACVISSVVPSLNPIIKGAAARYLGCAPLFVPQDLPAPIKNHYPRPEETGSDRLAAAYGARCLFPDVPSLIVADFGTAATFDCVSGDSYLGGLIFPGPGLASRALAQKTARLPEISLEFSSGGPEPCVDTATSIKHGIIFGYKYLAEGLCRRLSQNLPGPTATVATGAFALTLEKISDIFDMIAPSLTLDGLRNLYYSQIPASDC